jgi:hypothetical protein
MRTNIEIDDALMGRRWRRRKRRIEDLFNGWLFARSLRNKDLLVKYFSFNNLGRFLDLLRLLPASSLWRNSRAQSQRLKAH